jgi:Spy/CpxP family protein refolding chaperone
MGRQVEPDAWRRRRKPHKKGANAPQDEEITMKIPNRAVVCLLIVAAVAAAQQTPFGVMTSGPGADSATMIERRVARLTTLLSLTTSQASQATTIFTNAQAAITPLETALETARTSMEGAVKSNATAAIDQAAASIGSTTGQIVAIQNKADAAFYAILTTEQKAKLDAAGTGGPGGRGGRGLGRAGR